MSDKLNPDLMAALAEFKRWRAYSKQYGHIPESMEQAPDLDPNKLIDMLEKELEKANNVIVDLMTGPPAEMSTAIGLLPVNADGMHELVDALSKSEKKLKAAHDVVEAVDKWASTRAWTSKQVVGGFINTDWEHQINLNATINLEKAFRVWKLNKETP